MNFFEFNFPLREYIFFPFAKPPPPPPPVRFLMVRPLVGNIAVISVIFDNETKLNESWNKSALY